MTSTQLTTDRADELLSLAVSGGAVPAGADGELVEALAALRAGLTGVPAAQPVAGLASLFAGGPLPTRSSLLRRAATWVAGLGLGAKVALGAGVAVAAVGAVGVAHEASVLPAHVDRILFGHDHRDPVHRAPTRSPEHHGGRGLTATPTTTPTTRSTTTPGTTTPGTTTPSPQEHPASGTPTHAAAPGDDPEEQPSSHPSTHDDPSDEPSDEPSQHESDGPGDEPAPEPTEGETEGPGDETGDGDPGDTGDTGGTGGTEDSGDPGESDFPEPTGAAL